ncbi:MAG: hypothetical protein ACD_30C00040G0037 [uncultured bacterium]|uniref:Uncharacterized protein n=1 Tax=Candidatus Daviesbacteria bacterium GW2011_GWA1_36_8 TaxID=1618417 RepID=A0A0G0F6F4_9BACT|nr:MAG: hypothetical protein ACD_30C00040G0037 [uncultured bacterium]KKQ14758.1 MAG: hypothetical protein US28_C0030G0011 [Candidatus Daviesbacteria bacterium GW2011_GWA1_36_8]
MKDGKIQTFTDLLVWQEDVVYLEKKEFNFLVDQINLTHTGAFLHKAQKVP